MSWIQATYEIAALPAHRTAFRPGLSADCPNRPCRVGPDGRADCGALACPACGCGGYNLTAPDGFEGDHLVRCACGFSWIRP
ncbi:MAG: hypothetical protein C4305_07855 [Thermoleophilia bacterium]